MKSLLSDSDMMSMISSVSTVSLHQLVGVNETLFMYSTEVNVSKPMLAYTSLRL